MNSVFILNTTYGSGRDAQIYRAYKTGDAPSTKTTLKVSCSCTGNETHGARRCASKAFIKFTEPKADRDEIETRIKLTAIAHGLWRADLQPK